MRLLALILCVMLSGCFQKPMGWSTNPNSLYSINNGGVNVGGKPVVTEFEVIRGELYIY